MDIRSIESEYEFVSGTVNQVYEKITPEGREHIKGDINNLMADMQRCRMKGEDDEAVKLKSEIGRILRKAKKDHSTSRPEMVVRFLGEDLHDYAGRCYDESEFFNAKSLKR